MQHVGGGGAEGDGSGGAAGAPLNGNAARCTSHRMAGALSTARRNAAHLKNAPTRSFTHSPAASPKFSCAGATQGCFTGFGCLVHLSAAPEFMRGRGPNKWGGGTGGKHLLRSQLAFFCAREANSLAVFIRCFHVKLLQNEKPSN